MRTQLKVLNLIGIAVFSNAHFKSVDNSIQLAERMQPIEMDQQARFAQIETQADTEWEGCWWCTPTEPDYWWQDTWYSWGMDFYYTENAYFDDGQLMYCNPTQGNLYAFDPAVWGYYPGWTMVWAGYCYEGGLEWWQDTWYSWGMDFYYSENAYFDDGQLMYCNSATGNLYGYNPDVWGNVTGWPMYWAGYCLEGGLEWWQDTWYDWGMTFYYSDYAYFSDNGLQYCNPDNNQQYTYNPDVWGNVTGWPMYWSGECGNDDPTPGGCYSCSSCSSCGWYCYGGCCGSCGYAVEPDYWWQDTWYSWGMDFYFTENAYFDDGQLMYCNPSWGGLYAFDPAVWSYYPGWTMVWAGYCPDGGLEWWQDTWYDWGMYFYTSYYAYFSEFGLQYCNIENYQQYTYNPAVWGYVTGWTMYWSGPCYNDYPSPQGCYSCSCYGGSCSSASDLEWWQDTWYSWGMDFYYSDNAYFNDSQLMYCNPTWGSLYAFDPAVWSYYPGWTMVWAGYCPGEGLEWWQDTWYDWGMDFYNTENAYFSEWGLQYCNPDNNQQYTYNMDVWGNVQGWTMYWSGECGNTNPTPGGCYGCSCGGCCGCGWYCYGEEEECMA